MTEWKAHNQFTVDPKCGGEMVGNVECHCAGCHETFADVPSFDLHLNGDCNYELCNRKLCVEPETVGLQRVPRRSEATGGTRFVWARS
jgi:hypothetical protein